jgi:hypothetical protein
MPCKSDFCDALLQPRYFDHTDEYWAPFKLSESLKFKLCGGNFKNRYLFTQAKLKSQFVSPDQLDAKLLDAKLEHNNLDE